uniref:Uncharacterized protein n=1 Tax=uncultured Acidobacteriota bacterium TaxID=171953 RepID=H5SCF6_9BACT|nr:hypothetical protein HGMM_F10C03C10 [uncultured Acidobacteriota bacterium]
MKGLEDVASYPPQYFPEDQNNCARENEKLKDVGPDHSSGSPEERIDGRGQSHQEDRLGERDIGYHREDEGWSVEHDGKIGAPEDEKEEARGVSHFFIESIFQIFIGGEHSRCVVNWDKDPSHDRDRGQDGQSNQKQRQIVRIGESRSSKIRDAAEKGSHDRGGNGIPFHRPSCEEVIFKIFPPPVERASS